MEKTIEISEREANYCRVIAFNRFLDNVERALKGDEEAKDSLLAEDLEDVREYILPVVKQFTGWNAPRYWFLGHTG